MAARVEVVASDGPAASCRALVGPGGDVSGRRRVVSTEAGLKGKMPHFLKPATTNLKSLYRLYRPPRAKENLIS